MSCACSAVSREATGCPEPTNGGVVLQPTSNNAHTKVAANPQRGSRNNRGRTTGAG